MRSPFTILIVVLTAFGGVSVASESPREFVQRFCRAEQSWRFRGLPETQHEHLYDSYFGLEMISAIRGANRRLAAWMKIEWGPNAMIPHIESNLFSGFSEGPTTYAVGEVTRRDGRCVVEVHREYSDQKIYYRWTDRVLLDRDSMGWVVFDIECRYGGSVLANIHSFESSIQTSSAETKGANHGPAGSAALLSR